MIRNRHLLFATLTAAALILGASATAHAAVIVNDTFDVGSTPTVGDDAGDPQDVAWSAVSGGTPSVDSATIATGNSLRKSNSGWSGVEATLPTNSALNLTVGEQVVFSGIIKWGGAGSMNDNRTDGFEFTLFESTGKAYGIHGGTAGTNTNLFIVAENVTADSTTDGTMSSTISGAESDVLTWSLTVARTSATRVDVTGEFNGGTASLVDLEDGSGDFAINFSGGKIELRNRGNANDSEAFYDDVRLETSLIPEPASLALLGLGGLVMLRRSRGA